MRWLRWVLLLINLLQFTCYGQDTLLEFIRNASGKKEMEERIASHGYQLIYNSPDDVEALIELTQELAEETGKDRLRVLALYFRGRQYSKEGQLDSSLLMYENAIEILRLYPPSLELAKCYGSISTVWYNKGDLDRQMLFNDSAIAICDLAGLKDFKLVQLSNRAHIKELLGRPEETKQIMLHIYSQLSGSEDAGFLSTVSQNLYLIYEGENNADSALYYALRSLEYSHISGEPLAIAKGNLYVGKAYVTKGKHEQGMEYGLRALGMFRKSGAVNEEINCLKTLAEFKIQTRHYSLAGNYLDTALSLSNLGGFAMLRQDILHLKTQLLSLQGHHKEALIAMKAFMALKDSLQGEEVKKRIAELETKHQTRKREQELKVLKKDQLLKKKETQLLYAVLIASLLLFGLVVAYVLSHFRSRQKLAAKERLRLQAEVEKQALEERQLKADLELKTRQLTSKAMLLSERNELLLQLFEKTKQALREEGSKRQKLLQELRSELSMNLRSQSEWQEFTTYFEEINKDFIDQLKGICADLTEKDIRLLALTRLGLTTKEIANLMHIAPTSVKMARYRLKKKLNLDEETSVESFVQQM